MDTSRKREEVSLVKKYCAVFAALLLAVLCVGCGGAGKEEPVRDPMYEKVLETGLEGFAELTREELTALLGEPTEENFQGDRISLLYQFSEGEKTIGTVEVFYSVPPEEGVNWTEPDIQGEYPIAVSTANVFDFQLACPIMETHDSSGKEMTQEAYFDNLRAGGAVVCSQGELLEGDLIPSLQQSGQYYVYTPEHRYRCIFIGSKDGPLTPYLQEVVSLKHNPLWDGEKLCFRPREEILKTQVLKELEVTQLLGKTIEEILEMVPGLSVLDRSIQEDTALFSGDSFGIYLEMKNGRVVRFEIFDQQPDQIQVVPVLLLHGLPLSASEEELTRHMQSLGYQDKKDHRLFDLGYISIGVGRENGTDVTSIYMVDHSDEGGYEPVADPVTRAAGILEEYFRKNLAAYSYGNLFADLTHDGVDELLVIGPAEENGNRLTVYTVRGEEVVQLYQAAHSEVYNAAYGYKYLYTEDGLDYLMDVSVQISHMSANGYSIYSLDENGQPVVFREESTADGADNETVEKHKTGYIEASTLLISHHERYEGSGFEDVKRVDLMQVISFSEHRAKEKLGEFYNTVVSVKIHEPDPFADSGRGLPDEMLSQVYMLTTSSPLVTIGDAAVGMTEEAFLAALEPIRDPAFRQDVPVLKFNMEGFYDQKHFLEGTYYAPYLSYQLENGVVSEVTLRVTLCDPA